VSQVFTGRLRTFGGHISPPGAYNVIPELSEALVIAALPTSGFIPAYVRWAMSRNDAHVVYHLATALAMVTQTTHDDLCYAPNSRTFSNIYALCIGASTDSRKTTAISMGTALLAEALPDALQAQPDSKQGLIKSLGRKQRQLIPYPEFGDAISTWQMSYAAPIKTALTSAYDGTPIARGTSKELDVIPKPRLSLICGGAPEFLEAYSFEVDWMGGFLARFILFLGERERTIELDSIGIRDPRDVARLTAMLRERRRDGDRPSVGRCLGYGPETRAMLREWQTWQRSVARGVSPMIAASIGRANDIIPKIAMLCAWDSGRARRGQDWSFNEEEVSVAIAVAKHHCYSAMLVQRDIAASKDMQDRRRVLNAISKNRFKPTALREIISSAKLLDKRVLEIIRSLKAERLIVGVPVEETWMGNKLTADWYWSLDRRASIFAIEDQPANASETSSPELPEPSYSGGSTLDGFTPPSGDDEIESVEVIDDSDNVVSISAFRAASNLASNARTAAQAAASTSLDGPDGVSSAEEEVAGDNADDSDFEATSLSMTSGSDSTSDAAND
jgi:hypothetical protein